MNDEARYSPSHVVLARYDAWAAAHDGLRWGSDSWHASRAEGLQLLHDLAANYAMFLGATEVLDMVRPRMAPR